MGPGAVATQDATAHRVSHPYLAAVGIEQVTVEGAGFVPVQGGGRLGLMGAVADSALEAGGEVIGEF